MTSLFLIASVTASIILSCGANPPPPPAPSKPKPTDTKTASNAALPLFVRSTTPHPRAGVDVSQPRHNQTAKTITRLPHRHMNVVLVVIDALNREHLGVYGYHRDITPNIDSLAKRGVVFSNWRSNSPWTRPSFTTMITGVPKPIHGMEMENTHLADHLYTLAEAFRDAGYHTSAFVGNPLIQKKWNYHQGFDRFDDTGDLGAFPDGAIVMDNAVDWMTSQSGAPFFMCVFLTDPHTPYLPEPNRRQYSNRTLPARLHSPPREVVTPYTLEERSWIVDAYDDDVRHADSQVGRLITELDKQRISSRTTVAVIADHGEIFGAHNSFQHAYHMWEPVLQVPMVLHSPAIDAADVHISDAATHVDLMPTLLGLVGIVQPKTTHGIDLFETAIPHRIIVSAYDARGITRFAAVSDHWKLVRYDPVDQRQFRALSGKNDALEYYPSLVLPAPRWDLFELRRDPGETVNLYATHHDTPQVGRLRQAIDTYRNTIPQKPSPQHKKNQKKNPKMAPRLDPETLEALKAGGYIR